MEQTAIQALTGKILPVIGFILVFSVACLMTITAINQQKKIEDYEKRLGIQDQKEGK